MRRLATATGMTEGQAYTLAIGLVVALVTAAIGIPPTLRDQVREVVRRAAPAASSPSSVEEPVTAPAPAPADVAAPAPAAPAITSEAAAPGGFASAASGGDTSYVDPSPAPGAGAPGGVTTVASVDGGPRGIAVDPRTGAFFVATETSGIERYAEGGKRQRTYAVGPDRRLTGLVVDGDSLVALDATSSEVLRIDLRSGRSDVVATIDGIGPARPGLHAVVRDGTGNLLVSDAGQGVLWKVDAAGEVTEWLRDPQLLSPDGNGPAGLAIAPDGSLVLAVSRSVVALTGAVYRIPVGPDGAAGTPEELWRSAPDATLSGLAVTEDGRIHVAASNLDQLVVLDADGTEVRTVSSPELDAPYGIAARGRSLLVTTADQVVSVPAD